MRAERQAAAAVPWAFAESMFNAVNGVVSTVIVGYFLTSQDVGRAGAALAVIVLAEISFAFGIGEAVIRSRSIHASVTDSAYTGLVILSGAGACLCC